MRGFTSLLALGATMAVPAFSSLVSSSASSDYDFFYFVQQWPSTFCRVESCSRRPPPFFTIHGLWPDRGDGSYPQFCGPASFDVNKLSKAQIALMSEIWPSLTQPNDGFWAHEWNKHGTCATDLFQDEEAYFQAALDLHAKINLTAALFSSGDYAPGDDSYSARSVARSIQDTVGALPLIHCDGSMVSEIWFCVDKKLRLVDCDSTRQTFESGSDGLASSKTALSGNRRLLTSLPSRFGSILSYLGLGSMNEQTKGAERLHAQNSNLNLGAGGRSCGSVKFPVDMPKN